MKIYLDDEIKKSGKSLQRLIELLGHPCTRDLLGSSITKLKERIESLRGVLNEEELAHHRKNLLMGIAAVLGSGYENVMKNELEYRGKVPVGVGEGTRDRHPICDSALSGRPLPEGFKSRTAGRRLARRKKTMKKRRSSRK